MLKPGSTNFAIRGGFCCCNCNPCQTCSGNADIYKIQNDRIVLGEEIGPGASAACLSCLFPPILCLLCCVVCFCSPTLHGYAFYMKDNAFCVDIYGKRSCSEDKPIFISDVVDIKVMEIKRVPYHGGGKNSDRPHEQIFFAFHISHRNETGTGEIKTTVSPELKRFAKAYYTFEKEGGFFSSPTKKLGPIPLSEYESLISQIKGKFLSQFPVPSGLPVGGIARTAQNMDRGGISGVIVGIPAAGNNSPSGGTYVNVPLEDDDSNQQQQVTISGSVVTYAAV